MSVTVLVEFRARPGQRDELGGLIERMTVGPPMPGSLGSMFFRAVDDPDLLIEIVEWESVDKREAVRQRLEETDALAPLLALLGAPIKETVLEPMR